MCRVRVTLLAGVSAFAIAAMQPELALAADLPSRPAMATKAPPATFRDRWTGWVEGGATRIEGDPGVPGLTNFEVDPQRWGWEAAVGIEYQAGGSPWIWNAQFRYGAHSNGSAFSNPAALFFGTGTTTVIGSNSASRHEYHWEADFMVGRDLGLGQGHNVARFGVRVAQIRGKTTGTAQWSPVPGIAFGPGVCAGTPSYCGSEVRNYEQTNEFLGVGPRVQLDGDIPIGGAWSLNYMAGAAALYGRRKANQSVNINTTQPTGLAGTTIFQLSGGPVNASSSNNGFAFNLDAMLGLSYAFNANTTLMISYRFDGYWNALRGYDSTGNVTDLDRFYHGPMLRLTITN